MDSKKFSRTKIAFLILLIHPIYVALFILSFYVACSSDLRISAYLFVFLFLLYPIFTIQVNVLSVVFQIKALRIGESKVKNILTMVFSVLYLLVIFAFYIFILRAGMSV